MAGPNIYSSGAVYDPFWDEYYENNGMQEANLSMPSWMKSTGKAIGKTGGSFLGGMAGKAETTTGGGMFTKMAGAAGGALGGVLGTTGAGSITAMATTMAGEGLGTLIGGPAGAIAGK